MPLCRSYPFVEEEAKYAFRMVDYGARALHVSLFVCTKTLI